MRVKGLTPARSYLLQRFYSEYRDAERPLYSLGCGIRSSGTFGSIGTVFVEGLVQLGQVYGSLNWH